MTTVEGNHDVPVQANYALTFHTSDRMFYAQESYQTHLMINIIEIPNVAKWTVYDYVFRVASKRT